MRSAERVRQLILSHFSADRLSLSNQRNRRLHQLRFDRVECNPHAGPGEQLPGAAASSAAAGFDQFEGTGELRGPRASWTAVAAGNARQWWVRASFDLLLHNRDTARAPPVPTSSSGRVSDTAGLLLSESTMAPDATFRACRIRLCHPNALRPRDEQPRGEYTWRGIHLVLQLEERYL